jgi:HEAT repeat protein
MLSTEEIAVAVLWWLKWQMKSGNTGTRVQAARRLGESHNPRAHRALVRGLGDGELRVRAACALALGELEDQRGVPALLAALRSNRPALQIAAAKGLSRQGGEAAAAGLVQALANRDRRVRGAAAEALDTLGWKPATNRLEALYAMAQGRLDQAGRLGPDAREALLVALVDSEPGLRQQAVKVLSECGDPGMVKELVRLTRDGAVAEHAAEALTALLRRGARLASEEALAAAARIGSVARFTPTIRPMAAQGRGARRGIVLKRVVDCSEIRRLAREELLRRGAAPSGGLAAALSGRFAEAQLLQGLHRETQALLLQAPRQGSRPA